MIFRVGLYIICFMGMELRSANCHDICKKFGDYDACKRSGAGISYCGNEVKPKAVKNGNGSDRKIYRYIYTTAWSIYDKESSIWGHLKVTADPEGFVLEYESDPKGLADSYFFSVTGLEMESDHMIESAFSCISTRKKWYYECSSRDGTYIKNAHASYSLDSNGKYDMRFAADYYNDSLSRWSRDELRIRGDERSIRVEYYENGKFRTDISSLSIVKHTKRIKLK